MNRKKQSSDSSSSAKPSSSQGSSNAESRQERDRRDWSIHYIPERGQCDPNAGNLEAQAFLSARLGAVYAVSDDRREALYWFNQAKYGYEGLGHMAAVEGLETAIAALIQ